MRRASLLTLPLAVVHALLAPMPANAQALPEMGGLFSMQPKRIIRKESMERLGARLDVDLRRTATGREQDFAGAAIAEARRMLRREPSLDEVYFVAALMLQAEKDSRGFFDFANAAIRLAPDNWVYRSAKADQYRKLGRKQYAIDNYLAAAAAGERGDKPGAPLTRKWAADLLKETGKYQEAEREYEKSLAQFSAYSPEIETRTRDAKSRKSWAAIRGNAMSNLLAVGKKLAAARAPYKVALKDVAAEAIPEVADMVPPEMVQVDADARNVSASPAHAHYLRGTGRGSAGKDVECAIELLAATQLRPENPGYWRALAQAYLRQGRPADAANACRRACALGDSDACALGPRIQERAAEVKKAKARTRR